ncbi:MAG: DHA2 family efflux MFS transporter permease subunit [Tuberibacillus sp.]
MTTEGIARTQYRIGPFFSVIIAGAVVAFLNQTLINIAIPQIMINLHIDAPTANWLATIFMLTNGIVIPVTAYLMNRFTTRQLYLASIGSFTLGTLICAISPTFAVLLVGRVVQAIGAGILFPLITNIIFTIFPPHRRGFAMGIFGVAINFAPAIGPTLSGWVVENYSWRVLFFIILPFAIIDFLLAAFLVKNVSETSRPKLDRLGVVLSTIGFGSMLYGFSEVGTKGWGSTEVLILFLIGGLSLVLFVWRQFVVDEPILEFRIFQYPIFTLTTIINIIVTMALFAGMILMPLYMQNIRGFSPVYSGLLLLPGGIVMGIMSPITGKLFDKFGARWLSVSGLAITVVTTYMLTKLAVNTSFAYVTTIYTVRSFGIAILMMPIFTAGLNELPLSLNRYGTAMVNTLRMIAGSVGMAFFVSIFTNRGLQHGKDIMIAHHILPTDKIQAALAGREGYVMGVNDAFMVATMLSIIAFLLAFFIKRTEPKEDFITNRVRKRKARKVKKLGRP